MDHWEKKFREAQNEIQHMSTCLEEVAFKAKLYEGRAIELAHALEKTKHDRDRYRARVDKSDALLKRAKAVIPSEYEDEIEVRTAIIRHLNGAV